MTRISMGTALLLLLSSATWSTRAEAQEPAQLQIVNVGINLGWVYGIIRTEGITNANSGEIGTDLANAAAALSALVPLVSSPPYDTEGFVRAARLIQSLSTRIGGMPRAAILRDLRQIHGVLLGSLRVYLSARTNRLEVSSTCDSAIFRVGYAFGQGHTATQRGNVAFARRAKGEYDAAITVGEGAARRLGCPFAGDAYRGLSFRDDPTPENFARALPTIQDATLRGGSTPTGSDTTTGGGSAAAATTVAPGGRDPVASDGAPLRRPDLGCAWRSNYGDIHWSEGWYGSRTKTLAGTLRLENGRWVYRGSWGRTDSARTGTITFTFARDGRSFEGNWTEGGGGGRAWNGSSRCD